MIRLFTLLFQLALLAAVALWLADNPGSARIVWHGAEIDTSAAFLALGVLAVGFILHLLLRLWNFLRHGPALWKQRRLLKKLRQGQDLTTQTLIALASGRASEAGRLALAARKNMADPITAHWLQAQAAQLAGDYRAAQEIFRGLAAHPDGAILGYRGLIAEAKRLGQWDEVARLIDSAARLKQPVPWLNLILIESAARKGHWQEAKEALSKAIASRLIDPETSRRMLGAVHGAVARLAAQRGEDRAALESAEQAIKATPNALPAAWTLADALSAGGHLRAALRVLERAWKREPHPEIALRLRSLASDPLDGFRHLDRLSKGRLSTPSLRLALAEAALAADLWGEARRYLKISLQENTATQGVYRLLAKLERREKGDERAALDWLTRGAEASADPAWACENCGHTQSKWEPVCPTCGTLGAFIWKETEKKARSPEARALPYAP